ncbi:hypothetical protein A2223_01615 [Candidatus Falkowbacteria bacterium RIFOXYA2_FULL_35_8]|uniref:TrbC/VIRB2 family protein n=1 Tax=Candidatus Falkowbacteria bacterium RIFOXYC2_FULL_36_12 TaxID=1798002 RepID=A0A1F5T3C2_9BACT|nr:MAG: hypothetical protein A2300_03035 [Candidatus Falkowbacteria bacterium RIFOXYB2_FULL_35_7]OGF33464.1 MAG: hypothetical protein A2478_02105 [Candidatus Falkowbacteria bacterium RIFOXYC2_FULL_36_12]OGF34112.1 MAG: hypothetical protein A2223_01615 [Candidatus Falkowbacteria bacterium RIFOXYA2_FULL_35_8]
MKTKVIAMVLSLVVCLLLVAPVALAQIDIQSNLNATGEGVYGPGDQPSDELPVIIGRIINVVLGFMGVVMVLIVIYGGFLYMTAGGEPGKADKAKSWIINGIIGLIIMLSAYGITSFVITRLTAATGTTAN